MDGIAMKNNKFPTRNPRGHAQNERRTSYRVEVPGTKAIALCRDGQFAHQYMVRNLSACGALLEGLPLWTGVDLWLLLQFPRPEVGRALLGKERHVATMGVNASVVRVGLAESIMAVAIVHPPPDIEDTIHDALVGVLEHAAMRREARGRVWAAAVGDDTISGCWGGSPGAAE